MNVSPPSWGPEEVYSPPVRTDEEDRAATSLGGYVVQKGDDGVHSYNTDRGVRQSDPWLEHAFADLRGREELSNSVIYLTDDLRYLVAVPRACWYRDSDQQLVDTFRLSGTEHSRAAHGIIYERSKESPVIFDRLYPDPADLFAAGLHGAMTIDGQLYLLYEDGGHSPLVSPDGTKQLKSRGPAFLKTLPRDGRTQLGFRVQHDAGCGTLHYILTDYRTDPNGPWPERMLTVWSWSYKTGSVARRDFSISDYFTRRGEVYEAKHAVPVAGGTDSPR